MKILKKNISLKLALYPEKYFPEGLIGGDIVINNGTIEDFITITMDNIGRGNISFINDYFSKLKSLVKMFFYYDSRLKSKKDVSYHYDNIHTQVFKWMLGENMSYSCAYWNKGGPDKQTLEDAQRAKLKFIQKTVGAVPSPFDCWLTLLGIKTLSLRVTRHCENAQIIAEFLEAHSKVERVTYPGLPSHPQYDIAKDQMDGFSGMISMELKGGIPAGISLMNGLELCSLAESLGAVETMITHPATMTHADVPKDERLARGLTDGLVRLSVGIEDKEDIIADLNQALDKI